MDPLSEVLSLLKPQSTISAGLDAGGEWAVSLAAPDGIKFNAVLQGTCWLSVEGSEETWKLEAGDCYLLTQRRGYVLASNPDVKPVDATPICEYSVDGIGRCNSGGEFFLIGGRFGFAEQHADLLFADLPPVVLVRAHSQGASVLHWALERLATEMRQSKPGGVLVSEHLAHIMLVEALRLYLDTRDLPLGGWLAALADPRLAPVIAAIHAQPGKRWTLAMLAYEAGMSRSTFAERFREVSGTTPLAYITRWRMLLAGDRLRAGRESVATIAYDLGYESEGAFSTAFRKVMDFSPSSYRRREMAERAV